MQTFRQFEERLWQKVQKTDTCWEWLAAKTNGYGNIGYGGKVRQAHRVVYELLIGPIPEGMQLDHVCRNRGCVNPGHLEPVTPKVNMERGQRASLTHCAKGHPFSGDNLGFGWTRNWQGKRYPRRLCKACTREAQRRYQARKRMVG